MRPRKKAAVAQLVERLIRNHEVARSIRASSTKLNRVIKININRLRVRVTSRN
jgi:hypothetical protein